MLAALVLVWSKAFATEFWPAVGLLSVYATAIVGFRARRFLPGRTRAKLAIESWSMLAFISAVMWFTGKGESSLLNLYLLPIIFSALTLGRVITMLQIAAICACYLVFAAVSPHVEVLSLSYASRAVAELAPILLVAYLTSTLAADVTEARLRIEDLAHNDPLTGLLNLRTFNELWQREHAACERERRPYALLIIDVDQLDRVNDAYGREAGNSALTLVAQCLRRSVRSSDRAARLGGDEFGVLLPGAAPEIAEAVVKRIRNHVYKTTLDLRSRMIRCSVSIGVANFPRDGSDLRGLQSVAENAMYRDQQLRRPPAMPANS